MLGVVGAVRAARAIGTVAVGALRGAVSLAVGLQRHTPFVRNTFKSLPVRHTNPELRTPHYFFPFRDLHTPARAAATIAPIARFLVAQALALIQAMVVWTLARFNVLVTV